MSTEDAAQQIMDRIKADNERRLQVGETLALAVATRLAAEEQLAAAKADEKSAITEAKKVGSWTDAELAKLTGKSAPKRRARKSPASQPAHQESSEPASL